MYSGNRFAKRDMMRRRIINLFILLFIVLASTSCYSSRKNNSELRGLMLQDNLQLKRNRAYYSKHNKQTMKKGYKRYRKYNKFR
jgi:hypothetical protein